MNICKIMQSNGRFVATGLTATQETADILVKSSDSIHFATRSEADAYMRSTLEAIDVSEATPEQIEYELAALAKAQSEMDQVKFW